MGKRAKLTFRGAENNFRLLEQTVESLKWSEQSKIYAFFYQQT